jgi:uncharacterized protein
MSRQGGPSRQEGNRPVVACPGCGEQVVYRLDNPWRPFCSERCKQRDFGAWASEHYRVGDAAASDDGEEPAAPAH